MGWLEIVRLVFGLVSMAEQFLPQTGSGASKFNLVLNGVKAAVQAAPVVVTAVQDGTAAAHAGNVEQLSSNIGQLINGVVGAFNQAGVFQKSAIVKNAAPNPVIGSD